MAVSLKWAEKILVLVEQADVLLDQSYNIKNTLAGGAEGDDARPAVVVEKRFRSVADKLLKRFPETPRVGDLTEADEQLLRDAGADIIEEAAPYIETFAAADEVGRETLSLLSELLTQTVDLSWGLNPQLVEGLFELLTRYAKLNILLSGVTLEEQDAESGARRHKDFRKQSRIILTAAAKAKELTGGFEGRFSSTAQYLNSLEDPLVHMQTTLPAVLCPKLGAVIMSLAPLVQASVDWDDLQRQQVFSVHSMLQAENMATLPTPEQSVRFSQVKRSRQVVEWIIYAFMVCPEELEALQQPGFELFRTCLWQGAAMMVYRDEYLDVHERLKAVDKKYHLDEKWRNFTKEKKFGSDTKHYSRNHSAGWHRDRRLALLLEMESMVDFFTDMPTLTAPKVEMLLTILNVSRNEIMWYLNEIIVPPSKDWPPPDWTKSKQERIEWEREYVSDVLFCHDKLTQILAENQATISAYWAAMMKEVYVPELQAILATDGEAITADPRVKAIVDAAQSDLAGATPQSDFFPLRLNWQRVVAFWSSPSSAPCSIDTPAAQKLVAKMQRITAHSEYVDAMPRLLDEISMAEGFWFRKAYSELFSVTLNFQAPGVAPRHAIAFVRQVASFADSVPTCFQAERAEVGRESADTAQKMLQQVAQTAHILITSIFREFNKLYNQTKPENAVGERGDINHGDASLDLQNLQRYLAQLGAAVAETRTVVVYDRTFYPREFLRRKLASELRSSIWQCACFDGEFERMERPTVIKEYIVRYARSLSMLEEFVGIDVSEMLRAVLTSITYDPEKSKLFQEDERQQFSVTYLRPPAEGEPNSLPLCIAKWLTNLLQKVSVNEFIQYSEFFAGLVSGKLIGDKEPPQQNQFRAEEFCDINEFEAIASLVGPYGVKVIDHELLGFISSNVAQIDEWMKVNELQLDIFSGTWETEQQADQIMDALRGQADPLIVAGVNVGVALAVRRQLHTALKNVLTNTNDQLAQCVEMSALFASNGLRHNAGVYGTASQPASPAFRSRSRRLRVANLTNRVCVCVCVMPTACLQRCQTFRRRKQLRAWRSTQA